MLLFLHVFYRKLANLPLNLKMMKLKLLQNPLITKFKTPYLQIKSMNYFLNKLEALLSICIVSFMSIALSQNEEEKTPLWIEKGDIIKQGDIIGTVGSNEKINISKENGYDHVINYNKEDFAKKVLEITDGKGVPVVYDGVGKDTLDGSIECLALRGMMVSFGNASGPLSDINVPKMLQPKGLYLVRPAMQQYLSTKEELDEASKIMFEKISSGKVKINIFKRYKLDQVVEAHKDLEGRKILGPAVILP